MLARELLGRPRGGARSRPEKGAVAVEFALVLPVLVMMIFGIMTAGTAYSDHLAITNAVREGSRLGSAIDYNTGPSTWADSVQSRVRQVYFNGSSSLSTSQICVKLLSSSGSLAVPTSQGTNCGTEPTTPSNMPTNSCVVKVWVKKPAKISLLVSPDFNFSIAAQSVSYYGRTTGSCKAA